MIRAVSDRYNLVGLKFERLSVLEFAGVDNHYNRMWRCKCDCGNECLAQSRALKRKAKVSCGCKNREFQQGKKPWKRKHGMADTPEYKAYQGALNRCTNARCRQWKWYGGRGIEFRFRDFQEFFDALGFRPSSEHSVDRIDVDGHYEKGNVRWATIKEQHENTQRAKARLNELGSARSIRQESSSHLPQV